MTPTEKQMWELAHQKIITVQEKLDVVERYKSLFDELEEYFDVNNARHTGRIQES